MPSLSEIKNDLGALAAALGIENIRPGKKYRCPFHADKNPSLSVKLLDSGYYWRCWAGCGGGSIIDAIAKRDSVTPEDALRKCGCSIAPAARERPYRRKPGHSGSTIPSDVTPPTPKACRLDSTLEAIRDQNLEHPAELTSALRYRGLRDDVAAAHDVSYFPAITFSGRNRSHEYVRAWLMTIRDADGRARAVKIHREHVIGESKSGWLPVGEYIGETARHGWPALFPAPETYDTDSLPSSISDWPEAELNTFEHERTLCQQFNLGASSEMDFEIDEAAEQFVRASDKRVNRKLSTRLLYLCPGELKALAVISAGMDATAPTTGEGDRFSAALLSRLSGRRVVLVYDDDDAGRKFRDGIVPGLQGRCPELRAVTLGRQADGKIDANDYVREHGLNALRLKLSELVSVAPNLAGKPFDLDEHRLGLRAALSTALSAASGLHVFRAVVGAGKSHTVSELLVENLEKRAVIFAATHALAREYEERIPGALRVVSPERADEDKLIVDGAMMSVKCPSLKAIKNARKNNLPYAQICDACPFAAGCPVVTQRSKIASARVLILQHSHLRFLEKDDYSKNRARVIDETALSGMTWAVKFDDEKIAAFRGLLAAFRKSEKAAEHSKVLQVLEALLDSLLKLEPGASLTPEGATAVFQDRSFVGDYSRFLRTARGYNLAPDLLEAIRGHRFIRCGTVQIADVVVREYWMIRGALPDTSQPCIILDATAPLEAYSQLFGDTRLMTSWPESDMPAPESEVIQLVDGLYCRRSLHDGEKPTGTFTSICEEVRAIAKAKAIKPEEIGLITLKKLIGALHVEFPVVPIDQLMWYGKLRGLNGLKDCKLVVLIGCQPPPDSALAWSAVALNNLDVAPESLLSGRGRKWKSTPCDGGYDVQSVDLKDPRLNLAWDMAVTSELVQAIGRARPYAKRDFKQVVLVYCNQPLPMPVTRCCTRAEVQRSFGLASKADVEDRVREAMKSLMMAGAPFGMAELAGRLGVSEKSMLNKKYRDALSKSREALNLKFQRVGPRWVYLNSQEKVEACTKKETKLVLDHKNSIKEPALTSIPDTAVLGSGKTQPPNFYLNKGLKEEPVLTAIVPSGRNEDEF